VLTSSTHALSFATHRTSAHSKTVSIHPLLLCSDRQLSRNPRRAGAPHDPLPGIGRAEGLSLLTARGLQQLMESTPDRFETVAVAGPIHTDPLIDRHSLPQPRSQPELPEVQGGIWCDAAVEERDKPGLCDSRRLVNGGLGFVLDEVPDAGAGEPGLSAGRQPLCVGATTPLPLREQEDAFVSPQVRLDRGAVLKSEVSEPLHDRDLTVSSEPGVGDLLADGQGSSMVGGIHQGVTVQLGVRRRRTARQERGEESGAEPCDHGGMIPMRGGLDRARASWIEVPMLLTLLMACSIGDSEPATPGSTAETELAAVQQIQDQATKIKELSAHLEGLTDVARASAEGPARAAIIAEMRQVSDRLHEQNAALQTDVIALEARLHIAADDPTLTVPAE
jgi:hypothetical protein